MRSSCPEHEEAAIRTTQFLATYIVDFTKLSEEQKAGRLHHWPKWMRGCGPWALQRISSFSLISA